MTEEVQRAEVPRPQEPAPLSGSPYLTFGLLSVSLLACASAPPAEPASPVAPAAQAPAAIRPAKPEQIRTILEWGDLPTGKFKADGLWERFVRNPLTNQRRLQSSQYIEEVRATGTLAIHDAAQEKKIREFVAWAGREMGVGAARKMGWGRFVIVAWGA